MNHGQNALGDLRAGLRARTNLVPVLEAAFWVGPALLPALLTESVQQRFGQNCDIREVTALVARAAALAKREGPAQFPRREAEAFIRMALGEHELLEDLDLTSFDMQTIIVGVLAGLFAEWDIPEDELDELLARADTTAGSVPQIAPALSRPIDTLPTHVTAIPADIGPALALAETYRLASMWQEALAAYDKAIQEQPDLARAIAGRGMTRRVLGQLDAALSDYSRALELDPDDPWIIAGRAKTHRLMGSYELALADYDRAIVLDPTADWVIAGRAETYLLTGQHLEALADFSAAIDLDPKDASHRQGRAEVLEHLGRHQEAQADSRAAADLDPSLEIP